MDQLMTSLKKTCVPVVVLLLVGSVVAVFWPSTPQTKGPNAAKLERSAGPASATDETPTKARVEATEGTSRQKPVQTSVPASGNGGTPRSAADLLLTAAATPSPSTPSGFATACQRILIALVLLLLLAEAARSVAEFLKSLCAWSGHRWAMPGADPAALSPAEQASRSVVYSGVPILAGLCVAAVAGIDVLRIMATGEIGCRWWSADGDRSWGSPWGVVLTGLVASLGAAFIHDVLGIVQAMKNEKRVAAGGGATSGGDAEGDRASPRKT